MRIFQIKIRRDIGADFHLRSAKAILKPSRKSDLLRDRQSQFPAFPTVVRHCIPALGQLLFVPATQHAIVKLKYLRNLDIKFLIIPQKKRIRSPRNAMILTGKKIGMDHIEIRIHLCANINNFFGSLRNRSIAIYRNRFVIYYTRMANNRVTCYPQDYNWIKNIWRFTINSNLKKVALVTGCAGFIGYFVCKRLLSEGWCVCGIDNLNDYYDVTLKNSRLAQLTQFKNFIFFEEDIVKKSAVINIFKDHTPSLVIHLAAQAGVRNSIDNPRDYLTSNICGTFEILEASREFEPKHILIASTSSAYGANDEMPFIETMRSDFPMSFYAATKKATEVMGHSYSHIYKLPITMFRFFTVYGPWGRPDMALFKFTKAIINGSRIDVYNDGKMTRDFTYIDDLCEAIFRLTKAVPSYTDEVGSNIDSKSQVAPFRVVNIGNSQPEPLMDFIKEIEKSIGIDAKINFLPMQPGDVKATWADTTLLNELTGFIPKTPISEGVSNFVEWYRQYYS